MNKKVLIAIMTCGIFLGGTRTSVVTSAKEVRPTLTLQTGNKTVWSGTQRQINVKTNVRAFKKVTWKTSNKCIATVDKNGNVSFKKNGRVTISSTTLKKFQNKKLSKSVTFTVKTHVNSIEHKDTPEILKLGEHKTIGAKILPNTASDKRFTVTSSKTDIVKVEGKTLIGVKQGLAVVTVKSVETGKMKEKCVWVMPPQKNSYLWKCDVFVTSFENEKAHIISEEYSESVPGRDYHVSSGYARSLIRAHEWGRKEKKRLAPQFKGMKLWYYINAVPDNDIRPSELKEVREQAY